MRTLVLAVLLSGCMIGNDATDPAGGDDTMGSQLSAADKGNGSDHFGMLARTCAAGATTPGIDVSYYNGSINWSSVTAAGIGFAIVRVSDGTTFHDPKFDTYYQGAKNAGIVRGAYQFFRPAQSATAQADLMIAAVGTLEPGDLPPVIDVEVTQGKSPSAIAAGVRTWVDRVKAATGVDPIIYTGKYFWRDQVGAPSSFANNPLWIAQYTTLCPDLPSPWGTWAAWQYKDTGAVSGISGDVDMDKFNGSIDELNALAGGMTQTGGGSGSGGTGQGPSTCTSQTMGRDVNSGECVQAAADAKWYSCNNGTWNAISSTSGCTANYAWCDSATLGRAVPPRTCVQAASDNTWYQCNGAHWATPVDPDAGTGPIGLCSSSYPL